MRATRGLDDMEQICDTCLFSAVKKRKMGPNSDSQALPTTRKENGAEAEIEVTGGGHLSPGGGIVES